MAETDGEHTEGEHTPDPPSAEDVQPEELTADGGLLKKVLRHGAGDDRPETGDTVHVHYVGTLASDGSKFDSSRDRGEAFSFELGMGKVIKGWDEGVRTMRKGELAVLTCRAEYAYGDAGSPPKIPGGATLCFEVELLHWKGNKDITDDGGVSKAIVREGKGYKKPNGRDEVLVKYAIRVKGKDQLISSSPEEGEYYPLDKDIVCRAINIACKTMKEGEQAQLTIAPEYGFSSQSRPAEVPANANFEADLELVSWRHVTDLKSDGGIIKKTLVDASDWNKPGSETKVVLRYKATLEDGTVFEEHGEGNELHYTADEDEVVEGLDLAVQDMKLAEQAVITLGPRYAYGDKGFQGPLATVPPNATLTYHVHLVSFDKPKAVFEMDTDEKLQKAASCKEAGNAAFKEQKIARACKLWHRALKPIEHEDKFSVDEKRRAREIQKGCNLNLAAAELKLGQHRAAVTSCDKVLKQDAGNVKALYRRGQAYLALGDYIEAQQDVKALLLNDGSNNDAKTLQLRIRKQLAAANKKEAGLYSKMFQSKAAPANGHKVEDTTAAAANGSA